MVRVARTATLPFGNYRFRTRARSTARSSRQTTHALHDARRAALLEYDLMQCRPDQHEAPDSPEGALRRQVAGAAADWCLRVEEEPL